MLHHFRPERGWSPKSGDRNAEVRASFTLTGLCSQHSSSLTPTLEQRTQAELEWRAPLQKLRA
ncbi:MAG: hypothetical protein ACK55Z_31235, partial [bacterium]